MAVRGSAWTRLKHIGCPRQLFHAGTSVSEHKTGYIRKNLLHKNGSIYTCYQLNPQYKTIEKSINWNGEKVEFERNNRMLIWNRAERLKRLVLYTIKQINKSNG